jgi:hypothetical protein
MVFNTLKNTLAEFETYHYPEVEDGKIVKDMPEPTNNHIMDAIRYAIHGYSPALRTSLKVRAMSPLDVMLAAKAPKTEGSAEMDFR